MGAVVTKTDLKNVLNEVLPMHSTVIRTSQASSAVSVPTATAKAVCSIPLDAGTWIVVCCFRAPSNATGYRMANFSTTANESASNFSIPAVNGNVTQGMFVKFVQPTETTTYYLNVYQNSGSTLSYPAGAVNYITAIRIGG